MYVCMYVYTYIRIHRKLYFDTIDLHTTNKRLLNSPGAFESLVPAISRARRNPGPKSVASVYLLVRKRNSPVEITDSKMRIEGNIEYK